MKWYIAKKKTAKRWYAYELEEKPEPKRGHEVKGPFKSLVECLVESHKEE